MSDAELRNSHITTAFELNAAAALATVVGGLIICSHRTLQLATPMALATTLSISGGVTVFLSLVLSFGYSVLEFTQAFNSDLGDYDTVMGQSWLASTICLGAGIVIVYGVDFVVQKLTPGVRPETPKQIAESETRGSLRGSLQESVMLESPQEQGFVKMDEAVKEKLQRMGLLSGIAIALHNIPSGIATFTAGIEDPAIGLSMAIGVGLHNIAEGVAVAAPVYFATGSKWKGILWCVVAAIAEHVGAFIALAIVGKDGHDFAQATLYGIVAGMMATITMKEIFPTAYTYATGRIHLVSNGALMGMILMALSLSLFKHVGVGS
jgi:ZIP family zinc transporter